MKLFILCWLCAMLFPGQSTGGVIRENRFSTQEEQMQYLQKYGYMNASRRRPSGRLMNSQLPGTVFRSAVRIFQLMSHLPVTGVADEATIRMMRAPRCGVPDFLTDGASNSDNGPINFRTTDFKWSGLNLTYRISKFTSQMSERLQANVMREAFSLWSQASPLTFTRTEGMESHIDISFDSGHHGDEEPFDGPGGVLAHTFLPVHGGIHFDDDEYWSFTPEEGIDMLQVAAHEIGHAIGLNHSDVPQAIMYKNFQQGLQRVALHADDIAGIRKMYPSQRTPTTTTSSPIPSTRPTSPVGGSAHNCQTNNPCSQENTRVGKILFPHEDRRKYILCDYYGGCYDHTCFQGLWDPILRVCIWQPGLVNSPAAASAYNCQTNNPCTPGHARAGMFIFPHENSRNFIVCDVFGGCYDHTSFQDRSDPVRDDISDGLLDFDPDS